MDSRFPVRCTMYPRLTIGNERTSNTFSRPTSLSGSKALLPRAKEVIHDYYVTTRQGSEHHEDTCRLRHEEFDVDLLQSLTHVYAKSFIRQIPLPVDAGVHEEYFWLAAPCNGL